MYRWCSSLPRGVVGVSSHGRVQNRAGNISWGSRKDCGYYATTIGGRSSLVHRLVARAFLGLPPTREHCDVNHKDRDRSNNHAENLEYVTRSYNIRHSYESNPERKKSTWHMSIPVEARLMGASSWRAYSSMAEAARQLGLSSHHISLCCQGKREAQGGLEFRYGPQRSLRMFLARTGGLHCTPRLASGSVLGP